MFEAFVSLCLISAQLSCASVLLPGASAASAETCMSKSAARLPQWRKVYEADYQLKTPVCKMRPAPALEFSQAAPGIYVHRGLVRDAEPDTKGDLSNIGFVIGESSIAVIDSGGSRWIGEEIYYAIRSVSDLPVSHVVLTHMHPDHIYGASVFAEAGAKVIGHANLPRALADRAQTYKANFQRLLTPEVMIGSRIVKPDITVDAELIIELGNRKLQLNSWPVSHTNNDLTVLDRKSGILFTGDLVFDDHTPAIDGSLAGWQKVAKELASLPARQIVPGHGGPLLKWPGGDADQARYLKVLEADTRAALAVGTPLGEATRTIGQSEAKHWALFDVFNPRNATVAYTELEWE